MSLRLILGIIGILIVFVILIDGYRHWRRVKKHQEVLDKKVPRTATNLDPDAELEHQLGKKIDYIDDLDFTPRMTTNETADVAPQLDDDILLGDDVLLTPKPRPSSGAASSASITMPAPLPKKDKFIILHVLAEPDTYFSGEALAAKFSLHGLYYGPMDIFHYYEEANGEEEILFSVANAFEPGTLNLDYPKGFYTQGLTFFIQLPGECDTEQAFETMLNTATLLAKSFNARLCDHQRQALTPARIEEYRNEVNACNVI